MPTKQLLHELVDQLPEAEVMAAQRYLTFLIARDEPPIDAEMLARIDAARTARVPGISHDEVLREFGL